MLRTNNKCLALAGVALVMALGAGCSGSTSKPAIFQSPLITSTAQPNADGVVVPDGVYTLRVEATDPENEPLTFVWSATAGEFTTSTTTFTTASPGSSQIDWKAPATLAAVMDVSVSISDGTPADARLYVFRFHSSDACADLADGAACTINACIDGSTCQSHVCQGGTPKVPPALSVCQAVATCDPNTGAFTVVNKADNTSCATGNLCQVGEVCTAGQCSGGSSACGVPGAPTAVAASAGDAPNTVRVTFTAPASLPNSPILSYTVISSPAGVTGTGSGSPILVTCPSSCVGYAFAVLGTTSIGDGAASGLVHIVTTYDVTETFYEPETQPNDTIFTGSFTLDATSSTISNLRGSLTESMTNLPPAAGSQMDVVPLVHQLSDVSDGQGRHLVTVFALNTTDTFWKGGFAPGSGEGIYFGFPDAINPSDPGGVGNAYAMLNISISEPTATLTQAQIDRLAYADCTALGMMSVTCMTGTTVAGYGTIGTMKGYPVSQVVTKR